MSNGRSYHFIDIACTLAPCRDSVSHRPHEAQRCSEVKVSLLFDSKGNTPRCLRPGAQDRYIYVGFIVMFYILDFVTDTMEIKYFAPSAQAARFRV